MRKDILLLREMLIQKRSLNSKFDQLAKELSGLLYESETFISPAEVEAVYKSLMQIKNDPSIGDRVVKGVSDIVDKSKTLFGRGKKPSDPETNLYMLLTAWKNDGMSTRIEDVIDVAEDLGFNRRLVIRSFKKAGIDVNTGSDPKITDFAEKLKSAGLDTHIIEYLEKRHSITESRVFEEVISDRQIKAAIANVVKYHKRQSQFGNPSKVFSTKGKTQSSFDAKSRFKKLYIDQISSDTFYKKMGILREIMALASDIYGTPEHNIALQYIKLALKDLDVPNSFSKQVIEKAKSGNEMGRIRINSQLFGELMDRKYAVKHIVGGESDSGKKETPKRTSKNMKKETAPSIPQEKKAPTKKTTRKKTTDTSEKVASKKSTKAASTKNLADAKPKMTADTLKALVDELVSLDETNASQTKFKRFFTKMAKKMSEERIVDAEVYDYLVGMLENTIVSDDDRNRLLAFIKKNHPRPRNKTKEGKDLLSLLKHAILLEEQTTKFGRIKRGNKTSK